MFGLVSSVTRLRAQHDQDGCILCKDGAHGPHVYIGCVALQEDPAPLTLTNLKELATTVVTSTTEIVNSVKQTDWASEIEAFKQELQQDAQEVAETINVTQNLLSPRGRWQSSEVAEPQQQQQQSKKAPKSLLPLLGISATPGGWFTMPTPLAGLGRSLYEGTADLIAQANCMVHEEIKKGQREEQAIVTNAMVQRILKNHNRAASTSSSEGFRPCSSGSSSGGSVRYSRYDADVAAMQRNVDTYKTSPESEDFHQWREAFDLSDRAAESYALIVSNPAMQEFQTELVPVIVSYETFWTNYWYRLHKLQEAHTARSHAVQRALASQEPDEFCWDDETTETAETAETPLTPTTPSTQLQTDSEMESASDEEHSTTESAEEVPFEGPLEGPSTMYCDSAFEADNAHDDSGSEVSTESLVLVEMHVLANGVVHVAGQQNAGQLVEDYTSEVVGTDEEIVDEDWGMS